LPSRFSLCLPPLPPPKDSTRFTRLSSSPGQSQLAASNQNTLSSFLTSSSLKSPPLFQLLVFFSFLHLPSLTGINLDCITTIPLYQPHYFNLLRGLIFPFSPTWKRKRFLEACRIPRLSGTPTPSPVPVFYLHQTLSLRITPFFPFPQKINSGSTQVARHTTPAAVYPFWLVLPRPSYYISFPFFLISTTSVTVPLTCSPNADLAFRKIPSSAARALSSPFS